MNWNVILPIFFAIVIAINILLWLWVIQWLKSIYQATSTTKVDKS